MATHFSMLRSFVLADLLTLGNAACGTGALFACLRYVEHGERGFVWTAIALLPVALALDVADGTVARWRVRRHGSAGTLGADLDSLADVVSFGVAPAMLGYALGLRGGWDVLVLVYFVCCGIARLARYNATHDALSDASGKVAYYEGTPIPTSLVLVAAMAVVFGLGHTGEAGWGGAVDLGPAALHPAVLAFAASGSAMISATLRIPKP